MTLFAVISVLGSSVSRADDAPVTAPNVVAPAQPAAVQNVTSATTASVPALAAPAQQQPSMLGMALPFLIMLGIMYFLMIRPQQKKMKEHQTLMSGLKQGDEVVTSAGIFGTITGLNDKVVTLEVSKNVSLRVLKSQVNQVVTGPV